MKELIGRHVQIVREGLVIHVEIVEVRAPRAYAARPEVRVTPVSGHGEKWVSDWQHIPENQGFVEGPNDEQARS